MAPPTLTPERPLTVTLEPFTPSSFSEFGVAITCPFSSSLHTVPPSIPPPIHPAHQITPIFANQNSALKTSPISPLTNNYPDQGKSKPLMSMFSCFPRRIQNGKFPVHILERHPYTTQTFCPLGLSPDDPSATFLVIVAPSLSSPRRAASSAGGKIPISHPPDLSRVRAFMATGAHAVTYGAGTWHAPMVVVGRKRVDFVVTQFVDGVPEHDCEEVTVGGGDVVVDLTGLAVDGLDFHAKL